MKNDNFKQYIDIGHTDLQSARVYDGKGSVFYPLFLILTLTIRAAGMENCNQPWYKSKNFTNINTLVFAGVKNNPSES